MIYYDENSPKAITTNYHSTIILPTQSLRWPGLCTDLSIVEERLQALRC